MIKFPKNPTNGQVFSDPTARATWVFNGTCWKAGTSGAAIPTVAPTTPQTGELWVDMGGGSIAIKVWTGTTWDEPYIKKNISLLPPLP